MREMKDSGIEWIGEIPINWKICRLKDYAHICNGRDYSEVLDENGNYPVIGSGGQFAKACKSLYQKESVLLGRKGTIDKPLFVNYPFWTVDTMYYTEIKENVSAKYFYYLCTQINFDFYQYGSAVPSMTQRDLYNVNFPYPALDEQCRIANYLDRKCSQIDAIIVRQQEVIEKLKAYKLSIITEAVTKGLNPDVPMKDSGIEGIGKISVLWNIQKLKFLVKTAKGFAFKADDFQSEGVPVVKVSDIKNGTVIRGNTFISNENSINFCNVKLHYGDILMTTVGSNPDVINSAVGQIALVSQEFEGAFLNQNTVRIRSNLTCTNEFLYYCMLTKRFREYLNLIAHGTANQSSISLKDILDFEISVPPYMEQNQIAGYLRNKCKEIDFSIIQKQTLIEKFTAYKKSLIYEVVTGKKEV